jgi:hypothetical protein
MPHPKPYLARLIGEMLRWSCVNSSTRRLFVANSQVGRMSEQYSRSVSVSAGARSVASVFGRRPGAYATSRRHVITPANRSEIGGVHGLGEG